MVVMNEGTPTTILETLRMVSRYADMSATAREERDTAILMARSQGCTLRQIADAAGLTPSGIVKILRKLSRQDGASGVS